MIDTISIVSSTKMNKANYDDEVKVLNITFGSKTYSYMNVPKYIWEEFKIAHSKGKYFIHNIKGRYGDR